jgi:hypothetical protein
MLSKLDAALIVACISSGAMALENRGRLDISPDTRKVTLAPVVCRLVTPSGLPIASSIDIAPPVAIDPTSVDFPIECWPA